MAGNFAATRHNALPLLALPATSLQEHGHANVPARWPPNPTLAAWVEAQRRRWRGTQGAPLTATQHSRLISCGCVLGLPRGCERRA